MNEFSVAFMFTVALSFGIGLSIIAILCPWSYD